MLFADGGIEAISLGLKPTSFKARFASWFPGNALFFGFSKAGWRFRIAFRQPMVVVAQLVEPRIVIPVVAGSSPVDHPIFPIGSHIGLWAGEEESK